MAPMTLRIILGILLLVHGIGHFQGVISSLGLFNTEFWHPRSPVLDRLLGEKASRLFGLILWSASALGFLAAALAFWGLLIPHDSWRILAILSAIPSTLGLIFYWHSMAMIFNKLGAIAVNAWALIGLLILNWPAEGDLGF